MHSKWKNAIVVGATGGIGKEIASQLLSSGTNVALVGRDGTKLDSLADELKRDDARAIPVPCDVRQLETVEPAFQEAVEKLGGLDLIVYAAGIMPRVEPNEYNTEKDAEIIAVNLTGAIAWLNLAAKRFERAREGTIVGIGSVAGDRGRKGNPAYAASKAGLETYLESLRNRLAPNGVSVVTVKPGPVETPMTADRGKLPGMIPADRAARLILRAAGKPNKTAYIPGKWWLVSKILRAIPSPLFRRLNI